MYTTDLVGNSVDGLNLAMSKRAINIRYDFRIVDENGTSWGISPGAVTTRSRSNNLSDSSWQLTMTFVKSRLPAGLTIQQYHTIEIDRFNGGLWPYFRGVIQSIRHNIQREGGSIVETIEVTAEGVLSKLRGIYVPNYKYEIKPEVVATHNMLGIGRVVYQTINKQLTNTAPNNTYNIQSNGMIYLRDLDPSTGGTDYDTSTGNFLQLSSVADFSTTYTLGTHYKVKVYNGSLVNLPYTIEWINGTPSSNPIYVRYRVIDRFVLPKLATDPSTLSSRQLYFLCNRRDYNDLLFSTIDSVSSTGGGTNNVITPSDGAMYAMGIHDQSEGVFGSGSSTNYEYLTVTWPDGEERTFLITAINRTTGAVTLHASVTKPTGGAVAQSGYSIRVSTLEYYPAWDDRYYYGFNHNAASTDTYSSQIWHFLPSVGQVIPKRGIKSSGTGGSQNKHYWLSSWGVRPRYLDMVTANDGLPVIKSTTSDSVSPSDSLFVNRIEDAIKNIISKTYNGYKIFNLSDVSTTQTGILTKNFSVGGKYLDEIIQDIASQSFPANVFIKDRTDGTVSIKPYSQLSSGPQYVIPGIASVALEDQSEKITSLTVVSSMTEEKNIAPNLLAGGNMFDLRSVIDGDSNDVAYVGELSYGTVYFEIPALSPTELFPLISEIRISGFGNVSLFLQYGKYDQGGSGILGKPSIQIEGYQSLVLSDSFETIPGDAINKYIPNNCTCTLVFYLWGIFNSATGTRYIREIEILTKNEYAHTAKMTNNVSLASNNSLNSAGFGTSWKSPDSNKSVSFRYAPTSWIKRNCAKYGERIEDIYITNNGSYTSMPSISIGSPGTGASFEAELGAKNGGIKRANLIKQTGYSIERSRGIGFTSYPNVTFSSGSATAVADIIQHRSKVIRMDNISQLECRKYAESYMDEYLRSQTTYTVQAPLLDYAEPGDTVLVQLPDGSQKTLLLWGISDSGSALDNTATYTLRDYSL